MQDFTVRKIFTYKIRTLTQFYTISLNKKSQISHKAHNFQEDPLGPTAFLCRYYTWKIFGSSHLPLWPLPLFYSLYVEWHFDIISRFQTASKKDSNFLSNSCLIHRRSLTIGSLLNALQIMLIRPQTSWRPPLAIKSLPGSLESIRPCNQDHSPW